jgi:hypothetical protein
MKPIMHGGTAAGIALTLALGASLPGSARGEALAYETPEGATEALIAALEARDRDALIAVFGSENEDVVLTGDDDEDRATWSEFLASYRTLHRFDPQSEGVTILEIGRDLWPFPAPLVEGEGGWRFDAAAAREEVMLRRIGQNELDVIDLLRGYVRVQDEYRRTDANGDGIADFAASVISDAGTRNGLYWPAEAGAPESPVGDFMARAAAEGFNVDGTDEEPEPYLGYYFQVLQKQGDAAPGGALDYMVNGHMLAGHAVLAYPAAYGDTGIMSFMVGERGIVYEADLGEDTLAVAGAIDSFNPGEGWTPVEDEE